MSRTALTGLLVLLGTAPLLLGDAKQWDVPPAPVFVPAAVARFSAASALVEGDTLLLTDLVKVGREATGKDLAGRTVIGGGADVELALFTLRAGLRMAEATLFLGQEGPGKSFLQPGTVPRSAAFPFKAPVRVLLLPLGHDGTPGRPRTVTVRRILARSGPR